MLFWGYDWEWQFSQNFHRFEPKKYENTLCFSLFPLKSHDFVLRDRCKNNEKQLYFKAKLHFNCVEHTYCSCYNGYMRQNYGFKNAFKTCVISTVCAHGMEFCKNSCITNMVHTIQLAHNDDMPGAHSPLALLASGHPGTHWPRRDARSVYNLQGCLTILQKLYRFTKFLTIFKKTHIWKVFFAIL